MGMVIIFWIGVLSGIIVANIIWKFFFIGKLHVVTDNPTEEPYMFMEISKGVHNVTRKRYIVLKVDANSEISQK
jgi:hypothetical protein